MWKNKRMMLVVWTDESGDDAEKLEGVIELCRATNITVHVVGPSAVLGADTGLHAYTDPETQLVYLLPVTRGPDMAAAERLRVGYWFFTRPPRQHRDPRLPFRLPSWYGGRHLLGMSSGLSPYALTRLAIKTGGAYTIFDEPRDRPPFQLEKMRDYLPDYRPVEEYIQDIRRRPLRRAVHEAVQVTLGKVELWPPPMMLFGKASEAPPFRFEAEYHTPPRFRVKLRGARRILERQAARTAAVIEEALAAVSRGDDTEQGLDYEYLEEDSPRWRAWYDLTRGRLLATSVRLQEYRLACEALADADSLRGTTNFVAFFSTDESESSQKHRQRAEEAETLLTRCVRENDSTPWAILAQRELDYALGIAIRQRTLQPVSLAPAAKLPKLPRF